MTLILGLLGFANDATALPCIPGSPLNTYTNSAALSTSEVSDKWPDFQGIQEPEPAYDPGLDLELYYFEALLNDPTIFGPAPATLDVLQDSDDGAIQVPHTSPFEQREPSTSQDSRPVGLNIPKPMPGIRSSPMTAHSECSDGTVSPVILKSEPQYPNTSSDEAPEVYEDVPKTSPTSRDDRRSQEPPRNADGKIYCDHTACALDPPTFQRKCEWT